MRASTVLLDVILHVCGMLHMCSIPRCYTRRHTCGLDQGGAAHQLLEPRTRRRPARLAARVPT